jgi:glycosyltransferase involved in cell wall biosynthesis
VPSEAALSIRVAIISNAVTPYRIQLHLRVVNECPEFELWSFFTHEHSNAPWKLPVPDRIRPVFFGQGEESEEQGFGTRPLHEIRKARRIEKCLTEIAADAVVLFGYNDWCRLHLIAWCRRQRVPCFLFGDSNPLCDAGFKSFLKGALLPPILALCSGAMYCGSRGAEYFNRYGVPAERLFPFPYEPDYSKVSSASRADYESAVAEFGLPPGRRRILYAGRLAPVKRVDLLIAAFQTLAHERPGWDLVIAGDGSERTRLEALVVPSLNERVRFIGFLNRPESMAAIYGASDVLVLPSDYEPWGVVVTEAATRLALVCSSQVGAAPDLIEDHRNGVIFEAGSETGLVTALREVTDPLNIDRMKAASPVLLANWRAKTDPVDGLRRALRSVGLTF